MKMQRKNSTEWLFPCNNNLERVILIAQSKNKSLAENYLPVALISHFSYLDLSGEIKTSE